MYYACRFGAKPFPQADLQIMNKLFIITYRPATHNGRKTGKVIAYTVANPRPGTAVASLRATIMGPYGPIGVRTFKWHRIVSIVPGGKRTDLVYDEYINSPREVAA